MLSLHRGNGLSSVSSSKYGAVSRPTSFFSLHPLSTQLKTHANPLTGCIVPYTPMGRFIHVPPPCPRSDWANNFGKPWWKNEKYCIGVLSSKTRRVRVINTLTLQEQIIEVMLVMIAVFSLGLY